MQELLHLRRHFVNLSVHNIDVVVGLVLVITEYHLWGQAHLCRMGCGVLLGYTPFFWSGPVGGVVVHGVTRAWLYWWFSANY